MRLSVITPCYNGENFIADAILSVINQNSSDIEMIIVDDGSTDASGEICRKYAEQYPCVNYFRTENLGAGHARNYGMSKAKGEWTAFLDADDLYLPGSILKILDKASIVARGGQKPDIIFTPKCVCNMNLSDSVRVFMPEELERIAHHIPKIEFWTCICRSEFLKQHNIQFYEFQEQDVETAFRYRLFSNTDKVCRITDEAFYLQRNNLESNTHTWNLEKLWVTKLKIYYDLYRSTPIAEDKGYLLHVAYRQYCAAKSAYKKRNEEFKRFEEIEDMAEMIENELPALRRVAFVIRENLGFLYDNMKSALRDIKKRMQNQQSDLKDIAIDPALNEEELREQLRKKKMEICRKLEELNF